MDFNKIIKTAEQEEGNTENFYFKVVFESITNQIKSTQNNNINVTIKDTISEIKEYVNNYLNTHNQSSFRTKTIEYYLYKRMYSVSKYNLNKAYKDIYNKIQKGNINIKEQADKKVEYSYNLDDDMEKLVLYFVCNIKKERSKISRFLVKNPDLDNYRCTKKREIEIRKLSQSNPKVMNAYKNIISFYSRDEKEILQEKFKEYTGNSAKVLKKDYIDSIVKYIEFLDRFGIIEKSIEADNTVNRNIYLKDCNFTYEEIKEQLSEKNLNNYSIEQLMGMSLHFGNRVAKTLREISKCVYVLSHPELYEIGKQEDGSIGIRVNQENVKAVGLKMNILQRIFVVLYEEAEKTLDGNKEKSIDIEYETQMICDKYEKDYKNYLDKKLVYSNNNLRKDIDEIKQFGNAIYNSYKIKGQKMQALLIPILNKETDYIENYGFIEDKYRKLRNFKLIGFDIFGMNNSLRLHEPDEVFQEPLASFKMTLNDLAKYKGGDDFTYATGNNIPTQLYVPMPKEKCQKLKKNEQVVTEKDKYGKIIKHKNYIANRGKMPKHMQDEER